MGMSGPPPSQLLRPPQDKCVFCGAVHDLGNCKASAFVWPHGCDGPPCATATHKVNDGRCQPCRVRLQPAADLGRILRARDRALEPRSGKGPPVNMSPADRARRTMVKGDPRLPMHRTWCGHAEGVTDCTECDAEWPFWEGRPPAAAPADQARRAVTGVSDLTPADLLTMARQSVQQLLRVDAAREPVPVPTRVAELEAVTLGMMAGLRFRARVAGVLGLDFGASTDDQLIEAIEDFINHDSKPCEPSND